VALASAGATVIIATRRPEKAMELVEKCQNYGVNANAVGLNLNDLENIERTVDNIMSDFGQIISCSSCGSVKWMNVIKKALIKWILSNT
jgi:NAD(P)-dependent dehydrogenase (short-subunit alcohol dehydrogenase family)